MQTVINWRPYPEQKPLRGNHFVLLDGQINMRHFNIPVVLKGEPWWTEHVKGERVTHFALPEDITIINDNPKE